MTYTCPVCGYDKLRRPPADYSICPCCSTEFGSSDFSWTHEKLRQDWIEAGGRWCPDFLPEPPRWSAVEHLRNIGYHATEHDKRLLAPGEAISAGRVA